MVVRRMETKETADLLDRASEPAPRNKCLEYTSYTLYCLLLIYAVGVIVVVQTTPLEMFTQKVLGLSSVVAFFTSMNLSQ
jgi:hypothetical protein